MVQEMKPPVKTKYRSEATIVDGIRFSSKKEAKRWGELGLLERAGEIIDLKRQVRISLRGERDWIKTPTGRDATYVADFTYIDNRSGEYTVEDAKGFRTPEYKLKRAILAAMGITIKEV
jgi:hypothetical protein